MKVAQSFKIVLLCMLTLAVDLTLTGCGGTTTVSTPENSGLTPGNWAFAATSANGGSFYLGGNLVQNGNTVSGKMYVINSACFDVSQPVAISGTAKGEQVALTTAADPNGQVITLNGSASTGSKLSGTYSIAGGTCANGDHGTVSANLVPSINGTWSGPITGSGGSNVTLSIAISQAANASADGSFALTGQLIYHNSTCSVSGTITSGFLAGPYLLINATTLEQDNSSGSIDYTSVMLNSTTNPTAMTGTYDVSSGLCAGDTDVPTFTKQ